MNPDFAAKEAAWENATLNRYLAEQERGEAEQEAWEEHAADQGLDPEDNEARDKWLDALEEDAREAAAEREAERRNEMLEGW